MKLIKSVSWEEVYNCWKEDEKDIWQKHFNREDYKDWDEFRIKQIQELKNHKWELYESSIEDLEKLECGDFKHWNLLAKEKNTRLMQNLSKAEHFTNHSKIEAIKNNFPKTTTIIATKKCLLEGHHRLIALFQLIKSNKSPKSKIFLYLRLEKKGIS